MVPDLSWSPERVVTSGAVPLQNKPTPPQPTSFVQTEKEKKKQEQKRKWVENIDVVDMVVAQARIGWLAPQVSVKKCLASLKKESQLH